jgi:hypothetical protein
MYIIHSPIFTITLGGVPTLFVCPIKFTPDAENKRSVRFQNREELPENPE